MLLLFFSKFARTLKRRQLLFLLMTFFSLSRLIPKALNWFCIEICIYNLNYVFLLWRRILFTNLFDFFSIVPFRILTYFLKASCCMLLSVWPIEIAIRGHFDKLRTHTVNVKQKWMRTLHSTAHTWKHNTYNVPN